MKKALKLYFVLGTFLASALFVGCSDDNSNNPEDYGYTNEEIAELLAESLVSGGVYSSFYSIASYADLLTLSKGSDAVGSVNEGCGILDSSIESLNYSEGDYTSTGQIAYEYLLNCVDDVPFSLDALIDLDATYTGPDFTSAVEYTMDVLMGNLVSEGPFTLEGTVSYDGQSTYSGYSSDFGYSWSLTGGLIDKTSYDLIGGTGTISMTIFDNNGGSFNVSAAYTIGSDGNITMTINGESFVVNPYYGLES